MTEKNKKIIEQINNGIIPEGYKKTKIGIVPVEWTSEKFFSFCDVVNGGTPNTDISDYWNGNIFWCTPTDITNSGKYIDKTDKKITLKGLKNSSANLLPVNSILMCSRATIGPRSINTVPMATNQGFKSLIVDKKKADLLFINEILELCVPIFIRKSCGSTFLELSKKDVGNQLIPLPPLPEQQKIAEILSTQDKLIELYERKIEQLKTLKKGYLQKMFPKKGCKYPELRFKGFTEPWEQRKLGEIGQTYTGLSGKTKEDFGHGKAKFVTYMNVFSNPVAEISMTEPIEIDKRQNEIKYGDVFFTTSSETPEEVGMSSVWLENGDNTYLNSFCFGYRPIENINPFYMAYMLRSESVRKKITFLAQGISRYNISKNKMMEISIPLSKIEEQKKIGDYFRNLDRLITLHQHKLDKEKQKKKALMQLLLTGKVRVST